MKRLTLILLITFGFGFAQELELSLDRAEQLAMKQNFDLAIATREESKAQIGVMEAVGSGLPTISGYGAYTKNHELAVMYIPNFSNLAGPPIPITQGVPYNATVGLSVNQPLFTGGAIANGFLIAREAKNMSSASLELTRQNILIAVRTLYFQVEFMQSLINATEQASLSAETNLEQVEKQEAVGKASQFDVLQAKVKYQSPLPHLQSLKNQHETALTNLRAVMGISEPTKLLITDSLVMAENPFADASLDSLKEIAKKRRPEVLITGSQKDISTYQRNIAIGQTLPMLSLSADVRHQAQAQNSTDISPDAYVRSTSTSLNISWPLFSGGRKALGVQKSVIARKEADLQVQKMALNIGSEVEAAYLKVQETKLNITANASVREQAAEALRLARLMYINGSSTQLEVLGAESNYLQTQSSYYQSIFQYNVAIDQLKKATGAL